LHPLVSGALAGAFATLPMTAAMRRLHRHLPPGERHPLPPREIVETVARAARLPPALGGRDATLLAHFGYGALAGALFAEATARRSLAAGAGFGLAVWAASYLGWIPAARILAPATRHDPRRNALMLAVHVVWGAALVAGLAELEAADEAFGPGPLRDR
jgi:hypothetical protein